jgi:hypothetical protein
MVAEVFHSTIKDIHLALEVKTSFDNSMPATGSSTEPALEARTSTNSHRRHRWKEVIETCTQKRTKESLSEYAQQD